MAKHRRLSDLYVRGTTVTVDDGEGDSVTVYLKKLSPLEHEKALRKANAIRARLLAASLDSESEEFQAASSDSYDLSRDAMLDYLANDEMDNYRPSIEAELESEEPWGVDGYLQGLQDDWTDTLNARFQEDQQDPEARKVLDELERFTKEYDTRVRRQMAKVREDFDTKDDEALRVILVGRWLKVRGDLSWVTEFRRSQIWLAVREPENHKVHYFEKREEVDELPLEVLNTLIATYADLEVEVLEGKDLEETSDSSPSSEPVNSQETEDSSSPTESAA